MRGVVWNLEGAGEEGHPTLVCAHQAVHWQTLRGGPAAEAGDGRGKAHGVCEGERHHGPALQGVVADCGIGGETLKGTQR